MSQATLDQIFEPFFTTKAPGQGTGLGLATVYGIISQSRGTIAASSDPRKGTRFTINLPLVDAEVVEDVVEEAQVDGGGSETVLLVEDEPVVRQLVQEMLEAEGYEVVAAASRLEAIAMADAGTSPDVVLTDVTMPGMNGLQLAGELQQRRPSLRVVFTSGYAVDVADEIGSAPFLQKPFSSSALSQTVRAALDA